MGRKLTEVDKFYIEGHAHDMNPSDLARTLGCTVKTIKNHLEKLKNRRTRTPHTVEDHAEPNIQIKEPVKDKAVRIDHQDNIGSTNKGLRIDEAIGKRSGTVVMTQAASEMNDELTKESYKDPFDNPERVHRIK